MEGATALVHIQQELETVKAKVTAKEEKVIVTRGETPRKITTIPRETTTTTGIRTRRKLSKETADSGCELGNASAETIALLIIVTK